jgi:uncharacterized protein YkwD
VTPRRRIPIVALAFAVAALVTLLAVGAGTATAASPCPNQGDASAGASVQEKAMICLVNRARSARGLSALAAPASLAKAAGRKSGDILRCDEFSHEACGREFTYWIEVFGYRFCSAGENIAYGGGSYATPRAIFSLWMHSSDHRRNILGPYEDIGIGLQVGYLEGEGRAHVWTQEFGSREC